MSIFTSMLHNPASHTIGLNCTGANLQFVRLSTLRTGRIHITGFGTMLNESGVVHEGDIINRDVYSRTLASLLSQSGVHRISTLGVNAAVSEHHTFLKMITVPETSSDTAESIRWEATQHIPYELHDLYLDWHILDHDAKGTMSALIAASPKYLSDAVDDAIKTAGMTTIAIEPSSLSIVRTCAHQLVPQESHIIIHVGAFESVAIVIKNGYPVLSSLLHVSYEDLRKALMEKYTISPDDSEKALSTVGFYKLRARGTVRSVLNPIADDLQKRLIEIEEYYQDHFGNGKSLHSVLLCGPGALIAGIADEFSERLRHAVQLIQFPPNITQSRKTNTFKLHFQHYIIPFGAALRQHP